MTKEEAKHIVDQEFELDISIHSRKRKYVAARSVYYHICIRYSNISYEKFTNYIGFNHSTVINAMKKMSDDIETNSWEYLLELQICSDRAMLLSSSKESELVKNFDSITNINNAFKRELFNLVHNYERTIEAYEKKLRLDVIKIRSVRSKEYKKILEMA